MNVNLFQWIRDGVRQSVLLGVSDAVETLGTSPTGDNLSARLGEYLRANPSGAGRVSGPLPRKRLGRSLKELAPAEKPQESQ
jgi:hypothetical protein